jgi:outer membrane protein
MSRTHEASRFAAPAVCLSIALSSSARAQSEGPSAGRPMTVAECVAIAIRDNPDALSSDYDVRGAEAARAQVRGAFGPKVRADAGLQQWNSAFNLPFGGANLTVRDAFTWTAGVTLTQPITPLFAIYDQYKLVDSGVDVALMRRTAIRQQIALQVVGAYYRLLEAQRLSEVADASVTQLEAQEKQAHSLLSNGVIAKNDLLRAALALATARQRAIQVRGQIVIAQGQLASAMGVSPAEPVSPVQFTGEPPPMDEPTVQSAEEHAVAHRVELQEIDRRIEGADRGLRFARKKLFPQVYGVGNYTHFEGSKFQQADAAYVGLTASWDVWDWGTTIGGIAEADAKLQQARIARKKLEDGVRFEARQAFVNAATAREALGVARASVSQAEENYRIVTRKFDSSAATSFDVVDAEALLTQARGQVEQVLYDYLIARAALEKATGVLLPMAGR